MTRKKSVKDAKQSKPKAADDFEAVAKRLECDEDKARFETKLRRLAKPAPKKPAT